MADFDPYLAWLDIGPQERPVSPSRLLGLRDGESNPDHIETAAARVVAHLQQFTAGPQQDACRRLIAEVAAARDTLLRGSGRKIERSPEAAMSGPTAGPLWTERQIKAPPPVPTIEADSPPLPSPAPRVPPTSAKTIAAPNPTSTAPTVPVKQPPSVPQVEPLASEPAAGPSSASAIPVGTPVAESTPNPAITPVGLPLGQPVGSTLSSIPSPSAAPANSRPASWIPDQRSGQVGQVKAASDEGAEIDPKLTAKVRRMRRSSHRQTNQFAMWMAIGGVCLAVLLGLLFAVLAMTR